MLVPFGNNWIQKIPLTAKLDSACGLVQFWLSSEFFSSNYFQIGQHVVLLHILIVQAVVFSVQFNRKLKTRKPFLLLNVSGSSAPLSRD